MKNYTAFDEDLRSMVVESIQSVMNFETIKKIQLEHKKLMKNKKGMGKKGENPTTLGIELKICSLDQKKTDTGKPKSGKPKKSKSGQPKSGKGKSKQPKSTNQ